MKEKVKQKKKIKIITTILIVILIILVICCCYEYTLKKDSNDAKNFIKDTTDNVINQNGKFNVIDMGIEDTENLNHENSINEIQKETNVVYESERINKVQELQNQNSDIVGWLEIPNTNISYPILQAIDNDYYMRRNYKKRISRNGSLFLDKDYNWNKPSSNLLIYGHNNRGTNEMFVELLNYKDENYYKNHTIIRFTTEKEDAIYEIISVFLSRVYYKRETDVFRYYYFIDAKNENEFNYYVNESKKASLYNIDATAEYGDQLITLSTCEYSQEDGRFVVVARKKK